MTIWERRGRIALSLAVLLLFFSVVASMIAGRFLWPLIIGCCVMGAVGWIAMEYGKRFA